MRVLGLATLMLALTFGAAARAEITDPCGGWKGSCFYEPDALGPYPYFMDYTVPADGTAELWEFWLENDDPFATIELSSPNQVFTSVFYAGNPTPEFGPDPKFEWDYQTGPGRLSVRVRGPKSWNNCADPSATGVCGIEYNIWGNGTVLGVSSEKPGQLQWRVTTLAVPEPSTWAMLLMGFFSLGGALRLSAARRRGSSEVVLSA